MKKLIVLSAVILLAAIVMAFTFSSTKAGGSTPIEAIQNYYELLLNGDFKGAVQSTYNYNKNMTDDEKETMDAMLDLTASKIQDSMNEKGGLSNFSLGNASTFTAATVEVKITYGNGEEEDKTERLIKVGDRWYVE